MSFGYSRSFKIIEIFLSKVMSFLRFIIYPLVLFSGNSGIKCLQCKGWHGQPPKDEDLPSTCNNRNNQCEAPQHCVKIVDRMNPGADYVTYASDCYYAPTIQVNPYNLSYVRGRACFPFQDGSYPVKRWWYCFCNDRDYCNNTSTDSPIHIINMILFLIIITVATNSFSIPSQIRISTLL